MSFCLCFLNDHTNEPFVFRFSLQINGIAEDLNGFLSETYGMNRLSDNQENHAMSAFHYLSETMEGVCVIDEQISILTRKLERLRELRDKKRNEFIKNLRICKRNYPDALYFRFNKSLTDCMSVLEYSSLERLISLDWLRKRIAVIYEKGKVYHVNGVKSGVFSKTERWSNKGKLELNGVRSTVRSDDSGLASSETSFPVWKKERPGVIEIVSRKGIHERLVSVYNPGYFPNPFSDFIQKNCL